MLIIIGGEYSRVESNKKAVYFRQSSLRDICQNDEVRSKFDVDFTPWNLCISSWIGCALSASPIVTWFIFLASMQIRTLPSLHTIVRGFTKGDWNSSSISSSSICFICSLTAGLKEYGIALVQFTIGVVSVSSNWYGCPLFPIIH
jgi:hypothetical protein